jgi:hypothetical protein
MIDDNMVKIIDVAAVEKTDKPWEVQRDNIAQRMHEAGYRHVPSVEQIMDVFYGADIEYGQPSRLSPGFEAIHHFIMGEGK